MESLRVVNTRIAAASGTQVGVPLLVPDINSSFTAHPLGAAVSGSTGTVNPSPPLTALAERSMAEFLRAGG